MLRTTEALDREWRAEHEHSAAGAAAVARWRRAEPALQGLDDLGEVLAQRRNTERSSAVLAALARLAPTEQLAARTLLQALLPGLVHMALRRFADTCPLAPSRKPPGPTSYATSSCCAAATLVRCLPAQLGCGQFRPTCWVTAGRCSSTSTATPTGTMFGRLPAGRGMYREHEVTVEAAGPLDEALPDALGRIVSGAYQLGLTAASGTTGSPRAATRPPRRVVHSAIYEQSG